MQNHSSASRGRGRFAKITLISIPLVVAALIYYQNGTDTTGADSTSSVESFQAPETYPIPATVDLSPHPQTASPAKPESRQIRSNPPHDAAAPQIDVMTTLSLLEEIKRDDSGKLVVDTDSLRLLNKTVRALNGHPDDSSMAMLGEFIEAELPGPEGEKAREIFSTYVEYKSAEEELVSRATDAEVTTAAATLEQLSDLRRSYFGDDIAAQLFGEEEQFLRKTIAAMAEAEKEATTD